MKIQEFINEEYKTKDENLFCIGIKDRITESCGINYGETTVPRKFYYISGESQIFKTLPELKWYIINEINNYFIKYDINDIKSNCWKRYFIQSINNIKAVKYKRYNESELMPVSVLKIFDQKFNHNIEKRKITEYLQNHYFIKTEWENFPKKKYDVFYKFMKEDEYIVVELNDLSGWIVGVQKIQNEFCQQNFIQIKEEIIFDRFENLKNFVNKYSE